jgi:hypothetical protein
MRPFYPLFHPAAVAVLSLKSGRNEVLLRYFVSLRIFSERRTKHSSQTNQGKKDFSPLNVDALFMPVKRYYLCYFHLIITAIKVDDNFDFSKKECNIANV